MSLLRYKFCLSPAGVVSPGPAPRPRHDLRLLAPRQQHSPSHNRMRLHGGHRRQARRATGAHTIVGLVHWLRLGLGRRCSGCGNQQFFDHRTLGCHHRQEVSDGRRCQGRTDVHDVVQEKLFAGRGDSEGELGHLWPRQRKVGLIVVLRVSVWWNLLFWNVSDCIKLICFLMYLFTNRTSPWAHRRNRI